MDSINRAIVRRVVSSTIVYCFIPKLSSSYQCAVGVTGTLTAGDAVIVASIGGNEGDLVVIARNPGV